MVSIRTVLLVAARSLLVVRAFRRGIDDDNDKSSAAPAAPPRLLAGAFSSEDPAAPKHKAIDHALLRRMLCRRQGAVVFADTMGISPRPHHRFRGLVSLRPLPPPPKIWTRKEGRLAEIADGEKAARAASTSAAATTSASRLAIGLCHP